MTEEKLLTTLPDLLTSVTYSIRVSAVNSAGEGPLSQSVQVITTQSSKCVVGAEIRGILFHFA